MTTIFQCQSEAELKRAFPVLKELRTHLSEEDFFSLYGEMEKQGFQLYALEDEGEIKAVTGVQISTNFYNLRNMYVHDLVTKSTERSKGYGETLLRFIHDLARENDCSSVYLSSGLQRVDAHRFYTDKMGYEKKSYTFLYKL